MTLQNKGKKMKRIAVFLRFLKRMTFAEFFWLRFKKRMKLKWGVTLIFRVFMIQHMQKTIKQCGEKSTMNSLKLARIVICTAVGRLVLF